MTDVSVAHGFGPCRTNASPRSRRRRVGAGRARFALVRAALVAGGASVLLPLVSIVAVVPAGATTTGTMSVVARGIENPIDVAAGPDGNVWFVDQMTSSIGRVTPAGVVTLFTAPGVGAPKGIAAGPDGNLWFTNSVYPGGSIGRITPTGTITLFDDATISNPQQIREGPDGNLWFANSNSSSIGRVTTAGVISYPTGSTVANVSGLAAGPDGNLWVTVGGGIGRITMAGAVTIFSDATISSPIGITAGPDGNLWFVNAGNNSIGRITTSGVVSNFTDATVSQPRAITAAPDGNLWFTNVGNNSIGRITPAGAVSNFADPNNRTSYAIAAGPDGNLWYTNFEVYNVRSGSISRMTTAGAVTNFNGTGLHVPTRIVVGPDSNLWFLNSGSIGRITTGGAVTVFTDPSMIGAGGLTAGPDGNLWFTNSTAIGRMTPSGSVTTFTDPSVSHPGAITAGPDGNLWFVDSGNNSVGRITPTGVVAEYSDPSIVGPSAITTGPDGNLWFAFVGTESGCCPPWPNQFWFTGSGVGRITTTGTITTFVDSHIYEPEGITAGPDGNLWYTNYGTNAIGRITTAGVVSTFTDASMLMPIDITAGPDGNLWFTNDPGAAPGSIYDPVGPHSIGRITPAGATSSFTDAHIVAPEFIVAGPDRNLWFTDAAKTIGIVALGPAPAAPSNVTATAGNVSASVSWAAAISAGPPITAYTVTASPGGATCTWTSGPLSCAVTGLSNGTPYTFTVTATSIDGTGPASAPSSAVVPVAAKVSSLQPNAGIPAGGATVTIKGWGFTPATGVRFGSTPAASFTVVDDTTITAVTPSRPLGLVNVWVDTPTGSNVNGASSWFNYVTGPTAVPTITSTSPSSGTTDGGTSVTLTGTGFLSTSAVRFGPSSPAAFSVVSDTKLLVTAPAHAAGLVNIWVTNNIGTSASGASSWFTFKTITGPPPSITAVSPHSGPAAGGTAVTITGAGFTGATQVRFGTTGAPSFTVVNDSTITVTAPAHPAALVNVFVTTPNGTSTAVQADWFSFQ